MTIDPPESALVDEPQLRRLMSELRYQPYYCEENVWWLARHPVFAAHPCWALFITNERKQCAMWHQRAAPENGFVVWDYHVVLLVNMAGAPQIWDLDCTRGMPLPLHDYLDASFPDLADEDGHLRPHFRLVSAAQLEVSFSSDRRHMASSDGYHKPPPSWPSIQPESVGDPHTLARFIDLADDFVGDVLSLQALRARWSELDDCAEQDHHHDPDQ